MQRLVNVEISLEELENRIADLQARLPRHSLPVAMLVGALVLGEHVHHWIRSLNK